MNLAKGDVYLYVAVWDMGSRRMGSLEIPYHVDIPKNAKGQRVSK